MPILRATISAVLVASLVFFPLAALWGTLQERPLWLFSAAVVLTILRFAMTRHSAADLLIPQLVLYLLVMALAYLALADQAYLLHPVAMSGSMALVFAISLSKKKPLIETLARLKEPDLPPSGVEYTRKLTQIWLAFLMVNTCIAAATVFFTPLNVWAIYNGILFYCLAGVLLAADILYRHVLLPRTRRL